MTYDPFHFVFDKTLRDKENDITIDVTVVDPDQTVGLQLRVKSGALDIPFFLKLPRARMLAAFLLQACDASDKAVRESYTSREDETES